MNVGEQISLSDLGFSFGKTSQESSVFPMAKNSEQSSKKSPELSIPTLQFLDLRTDSPGAMLGAFWVTDGLCPGGLWMLNSSERPSEDVDSLLSEILEEASPQNSYLKKYELTPKACKGILKRAESRGKVLPKILKEALEQSVSRNELDVMGGEKESSSRAREPLPLKPSTTKQSAMAGTKVFGISPYDSNSMKSNNPNSGVYEAETARTLDLNGGTPSCNQGGMIVVDPEPACFSQNKFDKYVETDVSATLKQAGGNFGGGAETIVRQSIPFVQETTKESVRNTSMTGKSSSSKSRKEMND